MTPNTDLNYSRTSDTKQINRRVYDSSTSIPSRTSSSIACRVRRYAGILVLLALFQWGCESNGIGQPELSSVVSPASENVANPESMASSESKWLDASGNIVPGAKLYRGPSKTFTGVVLDEDTAHFDPRTGGTYDGVKLHSPAGTVEWIPRTVIAQGDWHVRSNDPALLRPSLSAR